LEKVAPRKNKPNLALSNAHQGIPKYFLLNSDSKKGFLRNKPIHLPGLMHQALARYFSI
jgi:hypothetical protein